MTEASGSALPIPGLRGLGFGNDGAAGPATPLYFTAGHKEKGRNAFGTIIPSPSLVLGKPAPVTGGIMLPEILSADPLKG